MRVRPDGVGPPARGDSTMARPALIEVEILKTSAPNPRAPLLAQAVASLTECVAWMDAAHRETDLSKATVADAKRILALAAKGGAR